MLTAEEVRKVLRDYAHDLAKTQKVLAWCVKQEVPDWDYFVLIFQTGQESMAALEEICASQIAGENGT